MTIGEYIESLLLDLNYYNTRFPRIPVKIDREIQAKLIQMQERRARKTLNMDNIHLFEKGTKVKAFSRQVDLRKTKKLKFFRLIRGIQKKN